MPLLPYNLSLIAIHISGCRQFSDIHISQGSVATYFRCGGIFKHKFVANLPLVNIWRSYGQEFSVLFFGSRSRFTTNADIVTHNTHPFNGPFSVLPRWAGTRKVKPIWILLKQETVSDSGISLAICKSASRSRQTTTPAPHHSVFTGRMPFLLPNQQRQSTEGIL